MNKRFMSTDELELEFGFKKLFQNKLRHMKKIPFVKIGNFVRYDRIEIEKWLEANAIVTSDEISE